MEIKKLKPKNRRYLGSKTKLLSKIKDIVDSECTDVKSFLDLFAGTGVVGDMFNSKDTSVIFNDSLYSNYLTYTAWFGSEAFVNSKVEELIDYYNEINIIEDNYISLNFADTFFSLENCRKIGFIREDIESKFRTGYLNHREKAILITSLLLSSDRIANTVGHYDAYRRDGDLNRKFILHKIDIDCEECNKNNFVYCRDANELVKEVSADVVYIDPPYNSRQYCDAYHFLENIAEWKKLPVEGVAKKFNRDNKKSRYSLRSAPKVFADLIKNIDARYILVSYNNMGDKGASRSNAKINDLELLTALSSRGEVLEFEVDFQNFTTGKSDIDNHKERLFLCKVGKKSKDFSTNFESPKYVKSPLNYTGGKFKLLPQILDKFPKEIDTFIDLFGGGFNVGSNIQSKKTVYNDSQSQLVRLVRLLYRMDVQEVISKVEEIIKFYNLSESQVYGYEFYGCTSDKGLGSHNKEGYYKLRNKYNLDNTSLSKDLLFLTLVIFSFNNQIRFNSRGEFNMPVGKRDFNRSIRKNLLEFSNRIKSQQIEFVNKDFKHVKISENSFVYCDPPYFLGLASYNESDGWNLEKEVELLDFLKNLDRRNIKFALSNVIEHKGEQNEILRNWIETNRFNKIYIKSSYNNSNYQIKNKELTTQEILVTNY